MTDREIRNKILNYLHEVFKTTPSATKSTDEIAAALGILHIEAKRALIYLHEKGLIDSSQDENYKWYQKINAYGIDEVEKLESVTPVKPKKDKKPNNSLAKEKFDEILAKVNEFFEEGMPSNDETVNELLEEIYDLMKASFLDGQSKIFSFKRSIEKIDDKATDDFAKNASNTQRGDIYRYVNFKKLEFVGSEIGKLIKELIQLDKEEIRNKPSELRSSQSKQYESEPLEIEISDDDFTWNTQIFISHKFVQEDRKLASTLKSILRKKEIFGYIADKKKEYTLPIDEKIQNSIRESQFLIAVITSESLKSASVNQEIGFALGYDVPVALMIEKGLLPEGVFTKGRDVEEFMREKFSTNCENIINYILEYIEENRNSIKLSKKDKELVNEKVYEHCYNMMKNIYDRRKYLDEIPPNPWKDITHALKLKTEPKIKDLFEKYEQELEKWSVVYTNWLTDFSNHDKEIMEHVGVAFSLANYLNQNGMIKLPQDKHTRLHEWVHHFKSVLFDPSINDATTLFERLLDFELATSKWQEVSLRYFYEKTDIFRTLSSKMKDLRALLVEVPYEEVIKQREILKPSIEKLTLALEEKIMRN